jgi:hypothetical protein
VAVYEPVDKDYFSGGEFAFIAPFEQGLAFLPAAKLG